MPKCSQVFRNKASFSASHANLSVIAAHVQVVHKANVAYIAWDQTPQEPHNVNKEYSATQMYQLQRLM